MNRYLFPSVLLALWVATAPCIADKVTSDPNVAALAAAVAHDAADPRLAQKVTYQSNGKRLHAIAQEISKKTGVMIRTGQDGLDWRVRDVPLFVCVKDMPLGKLLHGIATCAHMQLGVERIASAEGNPPAYKFYRTKQLQAEISGTLETRADANRRLAIWAWDTLVAYAKLPDASAEIPAVQRPDDSVRNGEQVRVVANVLASLGTEGKAKVLAGEQLTVKIGLHPTSKALADAFECAVRQPCDFQAKRVEVTDDDRARSLLTVRLSREDAVDTWDPSAGFGFIVHGAPAQMLNGDGRITDDWSPNPVALAKLVASVKRLKLQPPPDVDSIISGVESFPDAKFKPIKTEDDWKLPLLQKEAGVTADFSTPDRPTTADVLYALCKSMELNIISEDFVTCRLPHPLGIWYKIRPTDTIAGVLKPLTMYGYDEQWFVNADEKFIIGWISDWRKHHEALVPESLFVGLRSKYESKGVDIDDVVPLLDLTNNQRREWFDQAGLPSPGLCLDEEDLAFWRLYSALSSDDKQLAKSEPGLPLAKFDQKVLSQFIAEAKKGIDDKALRLYLPSDLPPSKPLVTDREMGRMVMNLRAKPAKHWQIEVIEKGREVFKMVGPGPNGPFKYYYTLTLSGPKPENVRRYLFPGIMCFPVFTPAHEAQLIKKAESNAVNKKQVAK